VRPEGAVADPLPQALVLTAIVIGFGVLAYSIALVHRTHLLIQSDDTDSFKREAE
jgi:multicomponent Na+:H+ antiporter subunit C